ncbi:MAG: Coat domain protein [Paenibacillus sp.]|nr:Coat domain protein [Paenibacillus sp.]
MQQHQAIMQDQDLLYTVLCDLKRTAREYTTAATESNCATVRTTFKNLLNQTLQQQEQLYEFMKQQNMYNTSSPALKQEIDKQIKQYQQDLNQTNQFVQQYVGNGQAAAQYQSFGVQ